MHCAYDLARILNLKSQIESIAAFGENLFIGTRSGDLILYSVTKNINEQKHAVTLLCYNKNFSSKPILQMDVITTYEVLVSLADGVVSYHSIHKVSSQSGSYVLNTTALPETRGATLFTLDITDEKSLTGEISCFVRLGVVVKRKLLLYYWKNGKFHELREEVTLPDAPKAVLLCQDSVMLGYKSEYSLLKLSKNTFQELFPISSAPEPIITRIDKDVFSLVKDKQCLVMNSSGVLVLKYGVKWANHPTCVVFDNPFLIGLLSDAVEIRTFEPNQFIQSLDCERCNMIARGRAGVVYIANASHVWCLQTVPVPQQIKSLLENNQFELALKLAQSRGEECEEEQKKNEHSIRTLYAHFLFSSKQYLESMAQFRLLKANPYDVIKLYPDLLPNSSPRPPQPKLTDRELEASLSALMDYLVEERANVGDGKAAMLALIDTTLLKCYLQTNDALVAPLLRINMIHFQEAERVLQKHNKISELVILYQTNEKHEKALSLLKQQKTVDRTIKYLQHLGSEHFDLILEYAKWVCEESPEEMATIFIEDTLEAEQWPRPQILNFLLHSSKDVAVPYIENAINTWNDTNPILHNTLANLYREEYQNLQKVPESRQEAMKIREKLLEFLEKSEFYTPQTVIDLFPKDDMLEERAIMLGKQGRHEQALSIYVCMLEDVQRAKQYCERVFATKAPGHDEVYVLLMRILISPPENWLVGFRTSRPVSQRDLNTAIEILLSNPDKINPIQALSVLPDDVPLRDIRHFMRSSMRARIAARRQTQILKGLTYSEHLQVQEQRMRCEARPILITELHICVICSKRFTSQSVFALIPAGVAHYGCLKEKVIS